jgi:hypothetical protein
LKFEIKVENRDWKTLKTPENLKIALLSCPDPGFPVAVPPCCCFYSPIVVDINGDGFDLTDAAGGIRFDASGQGAFVQVAWSRANSDDA